MFIIRRVFVFYFGIYEVKNGPMHRQTININLSSLVWMSGLVPHIVLWLDTMWSFNLSNYNDRLTSLERLVLPFDIALCQFKARQ